MKVTDWSEVLKQNQHKSCLCLMELGGAYRQMGRYGEAKACFEQALDLATEIADVRLQQRATVWIGNLHYHSGRFSEALEVLLPLDVVARNYHVQSVMHALGDFSGRADQSSAALASMSQDESAAIKCSTLALHLESLLWDGRMAEAWKTLQTLVTVTQEEHLQDFPLVCATARLSIARAYAKLGCLDEAKYFAAESYAIYEPSGVTAGIVRTSVILARLDEGQNGRDIEHLRHIEKLLEGFYEDPSHHISVKLVIADLMLRSGQFEAAKKELNLANTFLDRYNLVPDRLEALLLSCQCEIALENWESAIRYAEQAGFLENEMRATTLDFWLPLLKAEMYLAQGANSQFQENVQLANERYRSMIVGLPAHILSAFNSLSHAARLLELTDQASG